MLEKFENTKTDNMEVLAEDNVESYANFSLGLRQQISHSSFILSPTKLLDLKRKIYAKDISSYAKYIHDVAVLLGAQPSGQSDNTTIELALDIIGFESELAKVLIGAIRRVLPLTAIDSDPTKAY